VAYTGPMNTRRHWLHTVTDAQRCQHSIEISSVENTDIVCNSHYEHQRDVIDVVQGRSRQCRW